MPSIHSNRGIGRARKAHEALGLAADEPLPDIVAAVEERAGVHVVVLDLGEGVAGAYGCWRANEWRLRTRSC